MAVTLGARTVAPIRSSTTLWTVLARPETVDDDRCRSQLPDASSRGATHAATIPGPTCAPSTAPSSPHHTSRPSRLVASRSASRSASSPARSGLARWETHSSIGWSPAASTIRSSKPAERPGGGAHPVEVHDPALVDPQQRLDRQGTAQERRRGADPASPPEILQGVHVEQRRRRRGTCSRGRRRVGHGAAARRGRRPHSVRRTPSRHRPDESRRRSPARAPRALPAGRTRRCHSSPPTGGSRGSPWRRPAPPSHRPPRGTPETAATCSPDGTPAAPRRPSRGSHRRGPRRTRSPRSRPGAVPPRCRGPRPPPAASEAVESVTTTAVPGMAET